MVNVLHPPDVIHLHKKTFKTTITTVEVNHLVEIKQEEIMMIDMATTTTDVPTTTVDHRHQETTIILMIVVTIRNRLVTKSVAGPYPLVRLGQMTTANHQLATSLTGML